MPKQGTIVLVPFPFTNLSAAKVRPALVLSARPMKADIILAFISSRQKKNEYAVTIAPSSANGLKVPSVIICGKIATLEKSVLLGELGTADAKTVKQVKSKLAALLDL